MRILVDPEIFQYGRCGMTRYYAALCHGLKERGHTVIIPLYLSGSDFIRGKFGEFLPLPKHPRFRFPSRFINQFAMRAAKKAYYEALRKGDYDIALVTSPLYEDRFLDYVSGRPWVMVVHDTMRSIVTPDGLLDPSGPLSDRLAYLARRASKVICISETTARDLQSLAGIKPERLAVIHTGLLLTAKEAEVLPVELPDTFLLFVGERTGRKNFRGFLSAIAPLLIKQPDLYLVCTGSFNKWEIDMLIWYGVVHKVRVIRATDSVLVRLYRAAKCLVYPSLYEGYGLPVLEAMRFGCPVITSPIGAIQEIAGDAVLYASPFDPEAQREAISLLLDDPATENRMREAGPIRANAFSFEDMIRKFETELSMISCQG